MNIIQIFERFPTQEACKEHLEKTRWVTTQRVFCKRSKLSPDRVERLETLGFEWDVRAALWEEKFSELVRFKEEHDHCDVPAKWAQNSKLGRWVSKQRHRARNGTITSE